MLKIIFFFLQSDEESDFIYYPSTQNSSFGVDLTDNCGPIRIVKSLGYQAGLNKQDFEIGLSEDEDKWLEHLKDIHRNFKVGPFVSEAIKHFFQSAGDIHGVVLRLFAQAPDNSNPKTNSLSYKLIKELENHMKSLDPQALETITQYIDENLKMVAFNFFRRHLNLFPIIVDCYALKRSKHLFVDNIRDLLTEYQYKEACQIAQELELYEEFSIHDFVIPLIFQDKLTVAENYLVKATHMQLDIVTFFDKWLNHQQNFAALTDQYLGKKYIPMVNHSKLRRSTMKKLVKRFSNMYKIPKKYTPFLIEMDQYGMLKHLIEKHFVEKSLTDWDDFVKDNVTKNSNQAIEELINACVDFNDLAEAAKWVNYFEVNLEQYPQVLREYIEGNYEPEEGELVEEVQSIDLERYQIDLNQVLLVDSRDKFYRMISDLGQFPILGFDTEWKFGESQIDLIQLANSNRTYLIDLCTLRITPGEWKKFGRKVFNNEEILKLGFSQDSDISMLKKSLPSLSLTYEKSTSYIDLKKLWKFMTEQPGFQLPYPDCSRAKQDLRQLVYLCTGKPLDKSQQFSNWSRRPLTTEQILYAASDAYCLLDIYEVFLREAKRLNIDLSNFDLAKKFK